MSMPDASTGMVTEASFADAPQVVTPVGPPTPLTNLIPNPSFETNVTGWAKVIGTGSLSRDTGGTKSFAGSAALIAATSAGVGQTDTDFIAVQPSTVYCVSAYTKDAAGLNTEGYVLYEEYDSSHNITQVAQGSVSTDITSGLVRHYIVFTTNAATAYVKAQVRSSSDTGNANVFWDAVMLAGGGLCDYFDGDTADDALYSYAWSGTAHGSASSRTPL